MSARDERALPAFDAPTATDVQAVGEDDLSFLETPTAAVPAVTQDQVAARRRHRSPSARMSGGFVPGQEHVALLARVTPPVHFSPDDERIWRQWLALPLAAAAHAVAVDIAATLRGNTTARIFVPGEAAEGHLVAGLTARIEALGDGPLGAAALRQAAADGALCARLGVPVALLVAGAWQANRSLLDALAPALPDAASRDHASDLIGRAVTLHLATVCDALHGVRVEQLEAALRDQLRGGMLREGGGLYDPVTLLLRPDGLRARLQDQQSLVQPLLGVRLAGLGDLVRDGGYQLRDQAYAEIGARVRAALRGADLAAVQHDGLVTIVVDGDESAALVVARRLRAALESPAFHLAGRSWRAKVKTAHALLPAGSDRLAALTATLESLRSTLDG